MMRISVSCPQETVIIDRKRMRQVAETVLFGEGIDNAEISLAFVDNQTIQQLNRRYLEHDEPTDVLSFPASDGPKNKLGGELVIGAEVACAEAESREHPLEAELALYVIHGLLHLLGYDDRNGEGRAKMRAKEKHYLRELGYPDIAPDDS
jgi:probable rRNA maturation factor